MRAMRALVVGCGVGVALLAGCFSRHTAGGNAGGDQGDGGTKQDPRTGGRSGRNGGTPPPKLPDDPQSCVVSGTTRDVAITAIDKLDLLFVIDDSPSMAQEQEALRAEVPPLIRRLVAGDGDGDGVGDVPVVRDMHLGVLSTDMGAVGVQSFEGCEGFGHDGLLADRETIPLSGCHASYPAFLSYTAGVNDPSAFVRDVSCIAAFGTEGCGFGQPLEAALKALWPKVDPMPVTPGVNRITFLGDPNGFGRDGHGDGPNLGFLRNDPTLGLSVLAIVVMTDGDDCSARDARIFTAPEYLAPDDPLASQDPNLRCFYNAAELFPLERYIQGYRALRPGQENLVVFSVIAGVPPDLVEPDDYANTVWADRASRDAFYARVLNDPRMREQIDPDLPQLVPSCSTSNGTAMPARRLVQVAQGFGENGSIHSLCQQDFQPALDGIIQRIAKEMAEPCLDRELARAANGLVDCSVEWRLPPPGPNVSPSVPTSCQSAGYDFLRVPGAGRPRTTERGGAICEVVQLPVRDGLVPAQIEGQSITEGWYYDNSGGTVSEGCRGRIAFTPAAEPPAGVQVRLSCLAATPVDDQGGMCSVGTASAKDDRVGDACLPAQIPEDGFDDREAYLETASEDCGGGVCLVYRLRGDPRAGCTPRPATPEGDPGLICPSPQDIRDRVYCSCRCNSPDGHPECTCPDGFACVDVLEQGGPGARGGYCVREGTFSGG